MIYHELFGQHLRLGNFLFKFAWSIAMKEKFKLDSVYPESYYLWQYLHHKPLTIINENQYIPEAPLLKSNWEWSLNEQKRLEQIVTSNKNTIVSLDSFFQSEKWFSGREHRVFDALQFTPKAEADVICKYYNWDSRPTIGIGIRLGDFVGHGDFYQIPASWYIRALNEHFSNWKEDYNIVVFSDDIVEAKKIFAEYNFYYAQPNGTQTHADNFKHYHGDASEQFILGTLMDNFIIGNSTFSWWQAWLATYISGKVVHSGKVFSDTGNMKHVDTKNYYSEKWIKYELY